MLQRVFEERDATMVEIIIIVTAIIIIMSVFLERLPT